MLTLKEQLQNLIKNHNLLEVVDRLEEIANEQATTDRKDWRDTQIAIEELKETIKKLIDLKICKGEDIWKD